MREAGLNNTGPYQVTVKNPFKQARENGNKRLEQPANVLERQVSSIISQKINV